MKTEGAYKIELLFKKAAGLRLAKNKVQEIEEKIDRKLYDMLTVAEANAGYNNRDVIWLSDMPLTKAMRESMQKFAELEEALELQPILDRLAIHPPIKYEMEAELEKRLPEIVGTLIYVLAKITKAFSPDDNAVAEDELKKAMRILDLMI
ncbi:DUF1931 family protein [Hydrogenimonas cancrithermarum]|uniref:DUF1931 family protein n=1 Tax=Hydrogenimonas cancrithermarum TaxID=2993563 RepID=A0ABM8FLA1_9BACT|nr:DUF1931 family protein [Hydrogenimonas cancrithermarum]BDY13116.1 hypothetical protein HCR_14280 [Hydrogenimonas cancrithermarum]